jgi:hypothetical protein
LRRDHFARPLPAWQNGRFNGRLINVLGWLTTVACFAATVDLVINWII